MEYNKVHLNAMEFINDNKEVKKAKQAASFAEKPAESSGEIVT
jgi:hypothetical protein